MIMLIIIIGINIIVTVPFKRIKGNFQQTKIFKSDSLNFIYANNKIVIISENPVVAS